MADDDWGWSNSQPDAAAPAPPAEPANRTASPAAPAPVQDADEDWGWGKPPQTAPDPDAITEHGMFLPVGWDAKGNTHFDSDAGVLGLAKNTAKGIWSYASLPHDVATGQTDPNSLDAIHRSMGLATLAAPDAAVMTARKILTPPTAEALDKAADASYEAARNLGVHYSLPHVADMAAKVQQGLYEQGIIPELAPKTHAILDKLQKPVPDAIAVPLTGLEGARRSFGNAGKDFTNPTEQLASGISKNAIDDFVANPTAESVFSGPADQAASIIKGARGNAAAAFRSDRITKGEGDAELNAASAGSGQNLGNSIRQRAKSILKNPKLSAGFNNEELAAIKSVAMGTATSNTLRAAGNILGGGGGLGSQVAGAITGAATSAATGSFWGTAAGVITPLVGNLAKRADNRLTSARMNAADELVRKRSPLYRENAANAPLDTTATPGSGMVVRSAVNAAPALIAAPSAPSPRPMTPAEAAQYVKTLQPGDTFASGGAVKRKSHEELVSRLMGASEKAKASTKRDTKNLLAVPDNTVARALAIAQKSI